MVIGVAYETWYGRRLEGAAGGQREVGDMVLL